jgi:hypothetical protein
MSGGLLRSGRVPVSTAVVPTSSKRGGPVRQGQTIGSQAIAVVLTLTQIAWGVPLMAKTGGTAREAVRARQKVNRTVPKVARPRPLPEFSASPTDAEIFRARVFEEPLVSVGGRGSAEEDRALADAILTYLERGGGEDVSVFEAFLKAHPRSAWRAALLVDLGIVYRRTGYFSKALDAWREAWKLSRDEQELNPRAVADRAAGELAELLALVGRQQELEDLLATLEERPVRGPATERLTLAHEATDEMHRHPEEAFRCGVVALDNILPFGPTMYGPSSKVTYFESTPRGNSLSQLEGLSKDLGLNLLMARRVSPVDVPTPSIVHWSVGHYAGILREENGRYLVKDPALDQPGRPGPRGERVLPDPVWPAGAGLAGRDERRGRQGLRARLRDEKGQRSDP